MNEPATCDCPKQPAPHIHVPEVCDPGYIVYPPGIGAGPGAISFDIEIYDPKTGITTKHHCTGEVL